MGIFLLWTMWVQEYMAILVKIDGLWGVLIELEVCEFDKTWSACQ